MPYLQRHVEGLNGWLDLAQEVVVVDSFSTDGTVEYLRRHLKHPAVTYITHPPGLYASWNHGITQITAKYVFIAKPPTEFVYLPYRQNSSSSMLLD